MEPVKTLHRGEFLRLLDSIKRDAELLSTPELQQALRTEIAASGDGAFDFLTQERAAFRARLYAETLAQRQTQIPRRPVWTVWADDSILGFLKRFVRSI